MSYPFVHATEDYGTRKAPVLGFVVHMAEGGGTVGFLSNPTVPRGVSVHYVIENTGRIVQMLLETHASGSIDPTKIRLTDDPDGFYGVTANKAVLGSWWRDPNSAVISVEIEGFAANGPNAAQHGSLKTLVNDVRSRYPGIGLLGHRDFADYKACPGKLIHWSELGGHGSMGLKLTQPAVGPVAGILTVPKGTKALRVSDGASAPADTLVIRSATTSQIVGGAGGYLVNLAGGELHFIYNNWLPAGSFAPASRPADPDELAAAKAAGRESFRKDVEALP